jgi:hypothetical protein
MAVRAMIRQLLCALFGHRAERYGGSVCYGRVKGGNVDGIGREHYWLDMRCERCGQTFMAGRFHGPLESK